jgi:hypothetical protein
LSNEEKTNDYENFEKGMIYMKILKKRGDSREKGGGGNEIHAPCACDLQSKFDTFRDVKSHELKLYCSRHELN